MSVLMLDPQLPLPTVPGLVRGIVAVDPMQVQCEDCGVIAVQTGQSVATFLILARFVFLHGLPSDPRRCPACLAAAKAACSCGRCSS